MTRKNCPSCGSTNRVNARFCDHCGSLVAASPPEQPGQPETRPIATSRHKGRRLVVMSSDHHAQLKRTLKKVRYSQLICPGNRTLIRKYANERLVSGIRMSTTAKNVYEIYKMAIWLKKPFGDVTKDDMVGFLAAVESGNIAIRTAQAYKTAARNFFKWLNGGEMPGCVRWISVRRAPAPEFHSVLDIDDIKALFDACRNIRERAFILCLWESGCRIAEILNMRVKDASFGDICQIYVSGKTGPRRIRLIESAPILARWITEHPGDADEFLWMYSYVQVNGLLKRLKRDTGINKRIHPHAFRHSRATFLSKDMTDQQLRQIFGWTDSRMCSVYCHLSGRDTDAALEEITARHGLFTLKASLRNVGIRKEAVI